MNNQFDDLSISITNSLENKIKKSEGIFFTPLNIIYKSVELLNKYINFNNIDILEPSCGSCQFINTIDKNYDNINITGIEYNKDIFNKIKDLKFNNNVELLNDDFINYDINNNKLYDLIIGNPPYFVKKKREVHKYYNDYYTGRPNIFVEFIIHSLDKLKYNGILLFVLPKSITNCLYYNNMREHVNKYYNILEFIDCSEEKYIETEQDTIILIIQNNYLENDNSKYINKIGEYLSFNTIENTKIIKNLLKKSHTLHELGFSVHVGNIDWTVAGKDDKPSLIDDDTKTRIIYSSDIKDNKLIIANHKDERKKHYINKKGFKKPLLIVNRGFGKGDYVFKYCLIDIDKEYLMENHIIYIEYDKDIKKDKLINMYKQIIKSLKLKKTKNFIDLYLGNNGLNCTELEYILPIYL